MAFTLSRWLVLAAAPIVVATSSFGVGIAGFRADTLPGLGLPEAANPIAALSRYLDSRFVDSADVFYDIPSCRRLRAERAAPLGRSPSRPSGSRFRGRIPRGRHDDLVPGTPDLWRPGMSVILSADHGRTGGRNRVLGRGTCRSSPHTRDPDPFHWLDSLSRRKERRKIVQHAHRLDRFDLKLLDLVQQAHRQTLDLGERVGLSATAVRRLAVVGHAPDPAE